MNEIVGGQTMFDVTRTQSDLLTGQVIQGLERWQQDNRWLVAMPRFVEAHCRRESLRCESDHVMELLFDDLIPDPVYTIQSLHKAFWELDIRVGNTRRLVDTCPYPYYPETNDVYCGKSFVLWGLGT